MMRGGPGIRAALPRPKIACARVFPLYLWLGCAAAPPSSGQVRTGATVGATEPEPSRATSNTATTMRRTVVRTHEPSAAPEAAHHRNACDQGEPSQCHAAALDAYYKPRSPETDRAALQLFKKACDAGYAPSCNGLGVLFAEGRGVAQDLAQAAQLYHGACAAGASTGCEHLAAALSRGLGVPQDEAAADRARVRAKCVFAASLSDRSTAACPAALPLPGRGL